MSVSSNDELKQWLESNNITEVECIFPDMAGSSKGKILPVNRFIKSVEDQSLKLADSVLGQTVSGSWIHESDVIDYVEEEAGKLKAFEIKWNPKSKVKVPKAFVETYNSEIEIVNKENFREFLK